MMLEETSALYSNPLLKAGLTSKFRALSLLDSKLFKDEDSTSSLSNMSCSLGNVFQRLTTDIVKLLSLYTAGISLAAAYSCSLLLFH